MLRNFNPLIHFLIFNHGSDIPITSTLHKVLCHHVLGAMQYVDFVRKKIYIYRQWKFSRYVHYEHFATLLDVFNKNMLILAALLFF